MMVLFWAYGNIAFSVSLFFYCKLLYNIDIDQFIVVVVDRPIYNANLLNLLSCLDMLTIFGYAHCLWLCSLAFCDIYWQQLLPSCLEMLTVFRYAFCVYDAFSCCLYAFCVYDAPSSSAHCL